MKSCCSQARAPGYKRVSQQLANRSGRGASYCRSWAGGKQRGGLMTLLPSSTAAWAAAGLRAWRPSGPEPRQPPPPEQR